jgi:hypothetical protein
MKLSILSRLCVLVMLIVPVDSFAQGFQAYSQEVSFIKMMLDCPEEKAVPPMNGFGALYICTIGDEKTVKLYVSENPDSGRVQNIGMIWRDWKTNSGGEIQSDLKTVEEALDFIIDMYVPAKRDEIKEAFWDSKNEDLSTSDFLIYLTHKTDLQKDERLILIEEQQKQL